MVIKKRPSNLADFINSADSKPAKVHAPDSEAKKNTVKNMSASFSEIEYELLKLAAKQTSRSMKGYIRYAVTKAAKEDLNHN